MGMIAKIFSSFLKKDTDTLAAVFHIGSSSVCGALFWMRESGIPKIVFSVKEPINPEEKLETKKFMNLTTKALDVAAEKISRSGMGVPKKIFCVLASPWYVSESRTITFKQDIPFIFNTKLADDLIKKEIKSFEERSIPKYQKAEGGARTIEIKNLRTMLNNYEVLDPCNQKAKELEMAIFISLCGEEVLSKIEGIIERHFGHSEVHFSSFLMASFTAVRDMNAQQNDFLLVDIGGEVTDITMVKKNILRESASYPIGRNFMIRGLSSALRSSLEKAKSIFSLYKDGHVESKLLNKLKPAMDRLKTEWLKNFQSSLASLSSDISIPSAVFITIDKEFENFFAEIIKTEQFNQYTLTESKFQIIFLNTEKLHGAALFEENVIRDTFLIIDAIYINRFLNHHYND